MMRRLYTPPSANRSSCQRSRCASSFSPLHHQIGTGEKLRAGSSKRLSRSANITASLLFIYFAWVRHSGPSKGVFTLQSSNLSAFFHLRFVVEPSDCQI